MEKIPPSRSRNLPPSSSSSSSPASLSPRLTRHSLRCSTFFSGSPHPLDLLFPTVDENEARERRPFDTHPRQDSRWLAMVKGLAT